MQYDLPRADALWAARRKAVDYMQDRVEGKDYPRSCGIHAALGPQPAAHPLLLDTQVLLDLWLFEDPRVQQLGKILPALDWVGTAAMVAEWHYMMRRGIGSRPGREPGGLPQPRLLPPPDNPAPWRCRDPDDQMFLDLAHALRPCSLWSRDKALLAHRKRAKLLSVWIETPEAALARLGGA